MAEKFDKLAATKPARYDRLKNVGFITCQFDINELSDEFQNGLDEMQAEAGERSWFANRRWPATPEYRTLCGL